MPRSAGRHARAGPSCPSGPAGVPSGTPAPGLRAYEYGTLWYVGRVGYSWSATEAGAATHNLNFGPTWVNPKGADHRASGLPLRCLQEEGEGAAGPRDEASQSPVGAQPSRGGYNSFLSPAQAAGAPTFCDATESRQRTQPRGLSPPWLTPAFFGPPPENVRPVAHPLEALQNPGSSAQRHPAPGYRMYGSGRLSYVGNHGFNWSSSIPEGSVTARHLLFDYNVLYINHGYYRAFGFQLRCLQE